MLSDPNALSLCALTVKRWQPALWPVGRWTWPHVLHAHQLCVAVLLLRNNPPMGQVKAGIEKLKDVVKEEVAEDPKLEPRVAATAITYFDVLPEMIGYVLGSKYVCGTTQV
jgi:hypothetical protein